MKQIIDGKRYNTETAMEIASYDNGLGTRDFRGYEETLYKTKNGAWFLAGEGGPMTKYSQPCGDMTGGGEGIIPMTPAEVMNWLESHEETDAIEAHFPDKITEA